MNVANISVVCYATCNFEIRILFGSNHWL